jgi:hypothetical protein
MMLVYGLPATQAIYQRFWGHRRIGLFCRRLRDDSVDRKQYCPRPDPIGCWVAVGGQCRLFELYAAVNLESILTVGFHRHWNQKLVVEKAELGGPTLHE